MQAKVVAKKLVGVELPFVPGVTQGCKLDVPSYRVAEEIADDDGTDAFGRQGAFAQARHVSIALLRHDLQPV